jgi:hypothetical protein
MPTVLRSMALVAAFASLTSPLMAQRTPPVPAPTVNVPPIPPIPSPRSGQDFGEAMRVWSESLQQSLGTMGDSLGRYGDSLGKLGAALGAAETDESTNPSDRNRARIDSLKRAMGVMERAMARGGHGRRWRDLARQAHHMGDQARTMAMQATAPIAGLIARVQQDPEAAPLPPADSFSTGPVTIPAGTTRTGTVATANGDLGIFGTVTGSAIALSGNIEIHPGAEVKGNAFAAGGQVRVDSGGIVDGEVRSLIGDFGPVPATAVNHVMGGAASSSRWHDVRMALMAYALVLVLSIGVLTFADEQLGHATATLADRFGRSAWYGVLGAIALGPGLAVMCLALTITIVGILVVPFAVVGYCAIAIGAALLGFMAIAEATGTAILPARTQASLTPRGAQLRAIVTGVSVYCGLWVLTSLVGADSNAGIVVRSIAVVVTVVAVTIGFGAVALWRFDVRRASRAAAAKSKAPIDEAVWQTPTPVAGVAAASRTPPAASSSGRPS